MYLVYIIHSLNLKNEYLQRVYHNIISFTAGVAARLVRGYKCVPGPPPNTMEITFFGSALNLINEGTCKFWNSKHTHNNHNHIPNQNVAT
jgi:hypothetical protein